MINVLDINSYADIASYQSDQKKFDNVVKMLRKDKSGSIEELQNLSEDKDGLKKACNEFEAVFINMLLKELRKSIPKDGLIPRSFSVDTYEEMLDRQTASFITEENSLGIGDMLYMQLSGMRESYGEDNTSFNKGIMFERKG